MGRQIRGKDMKVSNPVASRKLKAGVACLGTALALTATPGIAQAVSSGVAHPDPAPIVTTDDTVAPSTPAEQAHPAKPSAAIPEQPAEVYGPYVPYHAPGTAQSEPPATFDPDANIVTEATAGREQRRRLTDTAKTGPDEGIVTFVPARPG